MRRTRPSTPRREAVTAGLPATPSTAAAHAAVTNACRGPARGVRWARCSAPTCRGTLARTARAWRIARSAMQAASPSRVSAGRAGRRLPRVVARTTRTPVRPRWTRVHAPVREETPVFAPERRRCARATPASPAGKQARTPSPAKGARTARSSLLLVAPSSQPARSSAAAAGVLGLEACADAVRNARIAEHGGGATHARCHAQLRRALLLVVVGHAAASIDPALRYAGVAAGVGPLVVAEGSRLTGTAIGALLVVGAGTGDVLHHRARPRTSVTGLVAVPLRCAVEVGRATSAADRDGAYESSVAIISDLDESVRTRHPARDVCDVL